jgi:NodT family efflux transporter outer membrane factor (OMF) lipoprotein
MRVMPPVVIALVMLAGCSAGPGREPPKVAGADAPWLSAVAPGAVEAQWWKLLHDPVLDDLVAAALVRNLDIIQAEARLREARANSDAARGRTAPQVNVSGSASEQQLSANGQIPIQNIPGFDRRYSLFDAGVDASWELDLWGGVARSVEASDARARASALRAEDTRLRIVAEVVRTYAELRSAQARNRLLATEVELRDDIAELVTLRFQAGEAARSDAALARQRANAARALVPDVEASARSAAYALALLTGRPPEALADLAVSPAPLPMPPDLVAAGVRSELLLRRPDVRAAEADLTAAIADIAVARVDLYPRFSLVGSLGQQAQKPGDLLSGDSTRFSIGPSFNWPIFSFGRIRAQIRAADSRADSSAAAYEKAVLSALIDSETAANRYAATITAYRNRAAAVADATVATSLALQRFRSGEDDRVQLLEAQSASLQAETSALTAQAESTIAYVSFAKALGGGSLSAGSK